MPARIVVANSDPDFLSDTVGVLRRAGYDAAGFLDSMAALEALQAAEWTELLITRVAFPEGTPHGVALARMARLKRGRHIKILFLARPDMAAHADGYGEVLVLPVTTEAVLAKVREMLGETRSPAD